MSQDHKDRFCYWSDENNRSFWGGPNLQGRKEKGEQNKTRALEKMIRQKLARTQRIEEPPTSQD